MIMAADFLISAGPPALTKLFGLYKIKYNLCIMYTKQSALYSGETIYHEKNYAKSICKN